MSTQPSFDDLSPSLSQVTFCVVDLETTGGGAEDAITEFGAVKVRGGEVLGEFQTLVNPKAHIPALIAVLTGITDAMVADAPSLGEVLPAWLEFAGDAVLVAHNARFDLGFLSAEFRRVAPTPLSDLLLGQVCTVRLARKLLAHLPRRNLDAVSHHYGVEITDRHRASGDALATAAVLQGLLRDASRRGVHTWDDLDGLLGARTGRSRRRSAMPTATDGAEGA